jgi:hypothetical protein
MKTVLLVLFTLLLTIQCSAKKMNYPLEVVAGMADLIVTGEIASVSEGVYQFNVSENIKGKSEATITVKMFHEWTCDVRWKKAEKGQQLFLFLLKKEGKYEIINGSTGELFIVDERVNGFGFGGKDQQLEAYKTAIKNFTKCYSYEGKYPDNSSKFRQLVNDKTMEVLRVNSKLSTVLFDRVKHYTLIPFEKK